MKRFWALFLFVIFCVPVLVFGKDWEERTLRASNVGLFTGTHVIRKSIAAEESSWAKYIGKTKFKGMFGEAVSDSALPSYLNRGKKGTWVRVSPRNAPQGFDHVYVKIDENGKLTGDVFIADSKFGSAKLKKYSLKDGTLYEQGSDEWARENFKKLGKTYDKGELKTGIPSISSEELGRVFSKIGDGLLDYRGALLEIKLEGADLVVRESPLWDNVNNLPDKEGLLKLLENSKELTPEDIAKEFYDKRLKKYEKSNLKKYKKNKEELTIDEKSNALKEARQAEKQALRERDYFIRELRNRIYGKKIGQLPEADRKKILEDSIEKKWEKSSIPARIKNAENMSWGKVKEELKKIYFEKYKNYGCSEEEARFRAQEDVLNADADLREGIREDLKKEGLSKKEINNQQKQLDNTTIKEIFYGRTQQQVSRRVFVRTMKRAGALSIPFLAASVVDQYCSEGNISVQRFVLEASVAGAFSVSALVPKTLPRIGVGTLLVAATSYGFYFAGQGTLREANIQMAAGVAGLIAAEGVSAAFSLIGGASGVCTGVVAGSAAPIVAALLASGAVIYIFEKYDEGKAKERIGKKIEAYDDCNVIESFVRQELLISN